MARRAGVHRRSAVTGFGLSCLHEMGICRDPGTPNLLRYRLSVCLKDLIDLTAKQMSMGRVAFDIPEVTGTTCITPPLTIISPLIRLSLKQLCMNRPKATLREGESTDRQRH